MTMLVSFILLQSSRQRKLTGVDMVLEDVIELYV